MEIPEFGNVMSFVQLIHIIFICQCGTKISYRKIETLANFGISIQGDLRPDRMSHRKRRETRQQPSRARSGHQISCCLISLHVLCDILSSDSSHTIMNPYLADSAPRGPPSWVPRWTRSTCTSPLASCSCYDSCYPCSSARFSRFFDPTCSNSGMNHPDIPGFWPPRGSPCLRRPTWPGHAFPGQCSGPRTVS